MRLLAATLLLLAALPAVGQRVNTTRIDIRPTATGGYACRFAARPDMRMVHGGGHPTTAMWETADRSGRGLMIVRAIPAKTPPGVRAFVQGFHFRRGKRGPAAPDGPIAAARVLLDGKASDAVLGVSQARAAGAYLGVQVAEESQEALARAMLWVKLVELELLDHDGKPLHRFAWDVKFLHATIEIPAISDWTCPHPKR